MGDEPTSLGARLWRAAGRVLAACLALWLGVRLLREIWWVLAIVGAIVAGVAILRWWRSRRW